MSKIQDVLRWEDRFRPRHMMFLLALVGLALVIWQYTRTETMSSGLAWTLWASLLVLFGFAIRSPDDEVITIIVWSILGLVGSTIAGVTYYELRNATVEPRSFLLSNPGGPELLSFATLTIFVITVLLAGVITSRFNKFRKYQSTSPEQEILTEEEYEEFEPILHERDARSLVRDERKTREFRWRLI